MWRSLIPVCCVLLVIGGCNRTSPEELLKEAEQARAVQNFPMAIELYTRVITEHPKSAQAEVSAFMIAATYNDDLRDYEKAISAYREYLQRYPQSAQAPKAQFLIGYLYHNELRNLDSAAAAYRTFLASYPDNEMAPSAQFELDNLGKPAEELIPQGLAGSAPPERTKAKKK